MSKSSGMPRIYLAGPEVFLTGVRAIGDRKKELCAQYGFEGVYPVDAQVDLAGLSPREAALRIGKTDEEMVRGCDAIVANITPFRGPSADVGTAYEMGLARGLGLVVCAYTNDRQPFATRTIAALGDRVRKADGDQRRDDLGMAIEDWGLADNLMLESSIVESGGCFVIHDAPPAQRFTDLTGFERCLQAMKRLSAFGK